MLKEIYEIGKAYIDRKSLLNIEIFMDKAKLKNTKIVFCLTIEVDGKNVIYRFLDTEEYSPKWGFRYLYKGGSSRGTDITPSSLIAKDIITTFENKILSWFKTHLKGDDFLTNIYQELELNKDKIENDLVEYYSKLNKNEKRNVLLTLKFLEGENIKYLYDYPQFKDILVKSSKELYYYLSSMGTSKGKGICYLCGNEKEVYGFVLTAFGFSFSTADKPGFVNEFIQENRWKEIPICEDCAITLEAGKKFLDENLSFKFYGNKYYLIPQIVIKEKSREILDKIFSEIKKTKGKEFHDGLVSSEDEISEVAKDFGNVIKLIFLFYSQKGGGKYIDVAKYVENVLPTHMRKIYETQSSVKKLYDESLVKSIFGKKEIGNFVEFIAKKIKRKGTMKNWYIVFARDFFKGKKEFLNYVGGVLSGKSIDRSYLISSFLNTIKDEYRNKRDYIFKIRVIESIMLYDFLRSMELIRGDKMSEKEEKYGISKERIDEFFNDRKETFKNAEAKAAFMVGALVNYVLDVQRKERNLGFGDEPFRSKLYGLNLDEKKIKKIFTYAVEKLSEYKRGTHLESLAADYLASSGNSWNLSKDEISYYFSLGMVLGSMYFWRKNE